MHQPLRDCARRAPLQARGIRRYEAILDAAAALLGETGYEALTLTAVAERSGSNIASLYRFFSNKEQLLDALADRVVSRIRAFAPYALDVDLQSVPIGAFVDTLVDRIATLVCDVPGLAELMGRIEHRTGPVDAEIAVHLDRVIRTRTAQLRPAERALVVRMTMAIVRSGIRLISVATEQQRRAVVAEVKTALGAYLLARLH